VTVVDKKDIASLLDTQFMMDG